MPDWPFVLPLPGRELVHLGGFLSQTWISASLALYPLIGVYWLRVVALQIRMRDLAGAAVAGGKGATGRLPVADLVLARLAAFLSLIAIFWLMIAKPA